MKTYHVAVIGATGAVGQEMVKLLESRRFPVESLRLFASERSRGRRLPFKGREVVVEPLTSQEIPSVDLALFSAGAAISQEYAPRFVEAGAVVVDNSSAWRMKPDIPLVVPEVNPHTLSKKTRLIANPNCSTIQMVMVLKPLHAAAHLERVVVSTYQATSGAGGKAMAELMAQTKAQLAGQPLPPPRQLPARIAFNVIPQIDAFQENGYTKEEMKMIHETKKILGDDALRISATTVRVPVFRGHSEAVWIETRQKLTATEARQILQKALGVVVLDDPQAGQYPMPIDAEGRGETFVGRIREDLSCDRGLVLWIVSDNLLKGAALNAIQIAELYFGLKS